MEQCMDVASSLSRLLVIKWGVRGTTFKDAVRSDCVHLGTSESAMKPQQPGSGAHLSGSVELVFSFNLV